MLGNLTGCVYATVLSALTGSIMLPVMASMADDRSQSMGRTPHLSLQVGMEQAPDSCQEYDGRS